MVGDLLNDLPSDLVGDLLSDLVGDLPNDLVSDLLSDLVGDLVCDLMFVRFKLPRKPGMAKHCILKNSIFPSKNKGFPR